jgi:hypothetical protein
MTRRMLWVGGLALMLSVPGVAQAGEVRLSIKDGRVTLAAHDATLREILVEWERVGGTRVVNRDRLPGSRLTLELPDVSEEQALAVLLRSVAGYMASRRLGQEGGASAFSRIVVMPAPATPSSYATASSAASNQPGPGAQSGPPIGRPGMQRRVLPDGRVVTIMDDSQRTDEQSEPDEAAPRDGAPGMMRPPFNAPRPEGQAVNDTPQRTYQPDQVVPTSATIPVAPVTVGTPGALPPAKPGAASPPPIKPPGD